MTCGQFGLPGIRAGQGRGWLAGGMPALLLAAAAAAGGAHAALVSDRHTAVEDARPDPRMVLLSWRPGSAAQPLVPLILEGQAGAGEVSIGVSRLRLESSDARTVCAAYHPRPVSGHFCAEAEFDGDDGAGLVLIRAKNGKPDPANYTSICVETSPQGKVIVSVRDRQNGKPDVLDCQGSRWWRKGYSLPLEGQYSVGVTRTAGAFRIFRDSTAGLFHFYFRVTRQIRGEWCTGWLELSPSPDWGRGAGAFYVGVCARAAGKPPTRASFSSLRAVRLPTADRNDRATGFRVVRRNYHWSGAFGEALVVTFGPEFPYAGAGHKLVFWSSASYVPFWHLSSQLGQMFESVEAWGGGAKGCYEPMSDRLLRYSRVEAVENNAARKVIRWRYVLVNPDYVAWGEKGGGRQLPEVEETWTLYPDGTALRRQKYRPCLDSRFPQHPLGNELCELDPLVGTRYDPDDLLDSQALSLTNLEGDLRDYSWPGKEGDFSNQPKAWKSLIAAVHYRVPALPDAFVAFGQAPGLFANPPLHLDSSWHRKQWYRFSHFPFDLQPYMWETNSQVEEKGQITHTSLLYVGAQADLNWRKVYQTDADGRKYREWVSLIGLERRRDYAGMRRRAASWMYGGKISAAQGCRPEAYVPARGELAIDAAAGSGRRCRFTLAPAPPAQSVVHPFFRVEGWRASRMRVAMAGQPLAAGKEYRLAREGSTWLLWVNAEVSQPTEFVLDGGK